MNKLKLSRRKWLALTAGTGLFLWAGMPQSQAAGGVFQLPFKPPASPDTWYVRQWYGNTQWAYRQRRALYSAGQGLHFGVDFAARCGTPILAIGDGKVAAVDGPYGAAPHNLLIRHNNGYVSLYGHLLERAKLTVGANVKAGDAVGLVGAPSGTDCDTHPHLHLEIRYNTLGKTVNPVKLIDVDWESLTLGQRGEGLQFQLNLDQPQLWQTPQDQPEVRFGAILLNDYARTWP